MRSEWIEPFTAAALQVLRQVIGGQTTVGTSAMRPPIFTAKDISIVIGLSGHLKGQSIWEMSEETALAIASVMAESDMPAFDEMVASAIAELCNMMCGHAVAGLGHAGFQCDLAPPTVVRGLKVLLVTHTEATSVSLLTPYGPLDVTLAMHEATA